MREPSAPKSPSFSVLVQLFFTEYLVTQRAVSPRTVACYRDGLMLFLGFARRHLGKPPTAMRLADIQPDLLLAFLDHLEQQRHNSIRSRNLRLTALRAFLKFASRRDVLSLHVIERALSVPMKRFEHPMLDFLTREENWPSSDSQARVGPPSATISCSPCCTTLGHECRRSSAFVSPTLSWMGPHVCTCTARAASSARCHCGRIPWARSAVGCEQTLPCDARVRCYRTEAGER